MYDAIVKLISESRTVNAYGDIVTEETERSVFAEIKSIGQSEFYQAQSVGLKPEIKFVLPDYLEYNNEKKIKFQNYNESEEQEYTILRTFRKNNELEIVCKRGVE